MFGLTEQKDKIFSDPFIHRETFPNIYPSKGDLIYSLQVAQQLFEDKLNKVSEWKRMKRIKISSKALKNKTLLIERSELKKKITIEKFAKIYPYKFEICGYDKIERAIVNNDSNFAYVQIVPKTLPQIQRRDDYNYLVANYGFGHRIVDAGNGKVLVELQSHSSKLKKMTFGQRVKSKHIRRMARRVK